MKTRLTKVSGVPEKYLYFARFEKSGPRYYFGPHRHHDFYEITYVESGSLTNKINDNTIILSAGELLLVKKNDIHEVLGENVDFINLVFPAREIDNILDDEGSGNLFDFDRIPVAKIPENERMHFESSMKNLMDVHGKPQALLAFRIFLYRTLMEYFFPASSHHVKGTDMPDWMVKCLNTIHGDGKRNWTLEEIRKTCGRSKEHVCRAFRKHLGMTPSQVINGYRLERADRMLRFTNQTVSEICSGTGFNNLSYFNRLFLKKYGTSPVKYRKINKY
ncbi:MAG TPA: hypothetical protein DCZ94_16180 [Lentisphaeria bacterium]|nr:MAG: hypothetical protein A2X48_02155 [Lentisphaerae bacterium GWF2_49_21]HBC88487.1 hypothetical protein [Lentisphaeria bacterium]